MSDGFKKNQPPDGEIVFVLDYDDIARMISMQPADREPYLRKTFNRQG